MAEAENFFQGITERFVKTWTEIGAEELESWSAAVKAVCPIAGSKSEPGAARASSSWIELNHLYWNLMYENTIGSLVQMPLLGPTRSFTNKLFRAFDAWAKLYPASIDYQIVLAEIQLQALEELLRELVLLAEKGEAVQEWLQLQQLWSRTADRVFEETFCSEDNLRIRGQLLNAVHHHKLCQQEVVEMWLKTMNLPLRSEMDEVHRNIYELRKELRNLKKAVARSEAYSGTVLPLPKQLAETQREQNTF